MSKLGLRALGAAAGLTVALATGAQAEDKVVNVFNWSDYIDQSVLDDFTKETGIKVVYDVFDSNDILETKLLAGGTGYDVVVPSAEFLAGRSRPACSRSSTSRSCPISSTSGLRWPNAWRSMTRATTMPSTTCGGTTGIGYNADKIHAIDPNAPIDSWKILFDPETVAKFKTCGIYVLDALRS